MRLTQNNSVTMMKNDATNPSMQNRTILIQCDRALNAKNFSGIMCDTLLLLLLLLLFYYYYYLKLFFGPTGG